VPSLDQSPGRPGFSIFRLLPRFNPRVAPKLRFPRLAEWWLFGFPRFPHLPAMPAVNFQVAPNLRSSGCACCGVSSRLEIPPFSAPGDQVLSRPSPWIFRRIRFTIPRVAPFPRFFVYASLHLIGSSIIPSSLVTAVPGFPGSSGLPVVPASHPRVTPRLHPPTHPAARPFQVALESGLPRMVRSSAVPAMRLRVASRLASFGAASA
jgi:hypothetical protein